MAYNFDTLIDRTKSNSIKWNREIIPEDCRDAIPLWVADMDFASPPEVQAAILERASHPIYGYTNRSEEYYRSLIEWMKRRKAWDIQKEWIVFSPGVVPALNIAVLAYTHPGDKIIIQPPVYYPFASAILNNGRQLVENPLIIRDGRYTMDFDDLEKRSIRTQNSSFCAAPTTRSAECGRPTNSLGSSISALSGTL